MGINEKQRRIDILLGEKKYDIANEKINELLNALKTEDRKKYLEQLKEHTKGITNRSLYMGEDIPKEFYGLFVDLAEVYINQDNPNYEGAENLIRQTISLIGDNDKIQNEMENEKNASILGQELLRILALKNHEDLSKVIEDVNALSDEDKTKLGYKGLNRNEIAKDVFMRLTESFNIKEAFQPIMGESESTGTRQHNKEKLGVKPTKTELPAYLLPQERLRFILERIPNADIRRCNIKKFSDYICIVVPETDLVIMEKFFTENSEGEMIITENTDATYIVPEELALECLGKKDLRELAKKNDQILIANHTKGKDKDLSDEEIKKHFPEFADYFDGEQYTPSSEHIPYEKINYYRNIMMKINTANDRERTGKKRFPEVGFWKERKINPNPSTAGDGKRFRATSKTTQRIINEKRLHALIEEIDKIVDSLKNIEEMNEELRKQAATRLVEIQKEIKEYLEIDK